MHTVFQDPETHSVIKNGLLGAVSSASAFTISQLEFVEAWLRVGSLVVGIIVSLTSLVYILIRIIKLLKS